jgi:DNA-binding helix-hairpin-helix protein with protein kinase domain
MNSNARIFDQQGGCRTLGPELASGGEGRVFPLQQDPGILVKCYHPEVLSKRGQALRRKTDAMLTLKDQFKSHPVSWPLLSVFDDRDQWVGYAMRRAQGVPMFRLAHAMAYVKSFPLLTRIEVVAYLRSLLAALDGLHRHGVRVGDYNLNNILCQPGTAAISLIDCDSYQLQAGGEFFHCPVGSPDMTPVEQHGRAFSEIVRTEESERFSVAIVLFKCLMLGRHPYDIVGGDDPVNNLKAGRFAYGRGNSGIPKGPWFNIWSHMPHRLKEMFIHTFTVGASQPTARPSLADWDKALQLYQAEMAKGWHEPAIKPALPKSNEYRGSRSQLRA